MQTTDHQQMGIVPRRHLIIGAVGLDVVVKLRLTRIAPLVVLTGGEGHLLIQHAGEHIHKGDGGNHATIEFGGHVDDGAHQQTTGAAPLGENLLRRPVTLRHQRAGHGDKIGKGVLLGQQPSIFIPAAPQLLAAAHMGQGKDETPIQQAQTQ